MVGLKRSLAPADGTKFEDILSFETETYYGIYNTFDDEFILIAKEDIDFSAESIRYAETLDELDDMVYNACGEHIIGVSNSSKYKLILVDD